MGARATRPGIDRWNTQHGFWRSREVERDVATAATREAIENIERLKQPEPILRIVHPVIRATHSHWYRVIREYQDRDHGLTCDDIGESADLSFAIAIARREIGRAVVLSPWNRDKGKTRLYDNQQPVEVRP